MIGYAIIGCGRIFPNHASAIKANPHAKLAAVADVKPEALEKASAQFDAHALISRHWTICTWRALPGGCDTILWFP